MDSEEDLFGQSHSAMKLRPEKTDEELDEDWWETEEDLTKTWRRLKIRKKAPAFMHSSTLDKITRYLGFCFMKIVQKEFIRRQIL